LAGFEFGLFAQKVGNGRVQLAPGLGRCGFRFGLGRGVWFRFGNRVRFGRVGHDVLAQLFGQFCIMIGVRLKPGVPAV
jgi:hypothetical protein